MLQVTRLATIYVISKVELRYPLIEIIFLVISAVICGCDGWKSIKDFGDLKLDWLRQFLPYKEGIPVDDTIARVMSRLETKQFQMCFMNWIQAISLIDSENDVIAIDGKTLRRSYDTSSSKSAIHMVSAWSCANGVVLGQEKTAEKSNEITAIPELLETLALKGCTVTIDAMGCQETIANQIIEKQADYVLALKGNQGNLYEETADFFSQAQATQFEGISHDFYEEAEAGHGRVEHRQCWVVNPHDYKRCFSNLSKWKKLQRIVMVKTKRELTSQNKVTEDSRFYLTSCQSNSEELLQSVRKHWQVENALHWTLDMTFREDESRIRKEYSAENFSIVRHIALNILKKDNTRKASIKRKLRMAALDDQFRTTLIKGII